MVRFYIKMLPGFETDELWKLIKKYHVNLTVLPDVVWCYGDAYYIEYAGIEFLCRMYARGDIEITLSEEGEVSGKEEKL